MITKKLFINQGISSVMRFIFLLDMQGMKSFCVGYFQDCEIHLRSGFSLIDNFAHHLLSCYE